MTIFYWPRFVGCPYLEDQILVFISPKNREAQLCPRTIGSFSSPPATTRGKVELFESARTLVSFTREREREGNTTLGGKENNIFGLEGSPLVLLVGVNLVLRINSKF
jgi:hypothetical protein